MAEADDDGTAGLAARLFVEKDGMRSGLAGVEPEPQTLRQDAAEPPVQRGFGIDDDVTQVVADQHRVSGVGEIAMHHADLDPRCRHLIGGILDRRGGAKAHAAHVALVGNAVGRRQRGHNEFFGAGRCGARATGRRGGQQRCLAGHQQIKVARQDALLGAQGVVRGILRIPDRHVGQKARFPAHRAVAAWGGEELQALASRQQRILVVGDLVVDHGRILAAGDVDHELGVGGCRFEQRPGIARLLQHRLVRHRPTGTQCLPEILPQRALREIPTVVIEGQKFHQPGKRAYQVDDFIGVVRHVEQAEVRLGRVVTCQPAHRFVGAAVGCAEHQEAAVRQRLDAPPQRRAAAAVGDHGTRHQAAHRVSDDVYRLLSALDLRQPGLQFVGEFRRRIAHRQPPVIGEYLDAMAAREEFQ